MAATRANEQREQLILILLGWIPDFAIAFFAMKLGDDEWSTFWWVWIGIQALYFLYWVKIRVWSSIVWRLWLRSKTAKTALQVLRECKFPPPERNEYSIADYLTEITEDSGEPAHTRIRAAEWRAAIVAGKSRSFQSALQLDQAWRDALQAYAATGST